MSATHLPPFSIRPRFKVDLPFSSDEVISKIKAGLKSENEHFTGKVVKDFAVLSIPAEHRHYWSPQLTISIEDNIEKLGQCTLRGMYSPSPSVWTMFVFFYTFIGMAILFITIIGGSNYFLDMPSQILWWVPILFLVLASLYFVSFTGQKLGHGEMESLHSFLEKCLGADVVANPSA